MLYGDMMEGSFLPTTKITIILVTTTALKDGRGVSGTALVLIPTSMVHSSKRGKIGGGLRTTILLDQH